MLAFWHNYLLIDSFDNMSMSVELFNTAFQLPYFYRTLDAVTAIGLRKIWQPLLIKFHNYGRIIMNFLLPLNRELEKLFRNPNLTNWLIADFRPHFLSSDVKPRMFGIKTIPKEISIRVNHFKVNGSCSMH